MRITPTCLALGLALGVGLTACGEDAADARTPRPDLAASAADAQGAKDGDAAGNDAAATSAADTAATKSAGTLPDAAALERAALRAACSAVAADCARAASDAESWCSDADRTAPCAGEETRPGLFGMPYVPGTLYAELYDALEAMRASCAESYTDSEATPVPWGDDESWPGSVATASDGESDWEILAES